LNRPTQLALLLLALLAVAIVILATTFGIGITPDSTVYLEAARNLIKGQGLVALAANGELQPMTHYPPLYSSLLALLGLVFAPVAAGARWLQAVLFGANVLLVGIAIARYARDSFWLPVIGALLMLTAPDLATVHTLALTEPLFLLLAMSSLLAMARHLETNRYSWLLAAASFAALAVLTRYVGVAVIITGAAALLLSGKRQWRGRVSAALIFGALAGVPLVLWTIRNISLTGSQTDRQVSFHPPGLKQVVTGFSTVSSWLLLGKVRGDLRIGFFAVEVVLIGLFLVFLIRDKRNSIVGDRQTPPNENPERLSLVLIIFIASYLGCIIIATSFFDLVIFDERTLVPVHVVTIILLMVSSSKLLARGPEMRWIRIVLVCMAVALVGSYSFRTANWFDRTRRDGQGYASRAWKESETIQHVNRLPPGTPIYSNAYDAVYYLTGRPAILIPEKTVFITGKPNQNYEVELEKMGKDLRDTKGVLVYFNTLPERWYLPSESELRSQLPLTEIGTLPDGSLNKLLP
jgi:4-amino-4-deoxy-L-arabinose transferase-like glycosyltransferase